MKLHANKAALAAATTLTSLSLVTHLFSRFKLTQQIFIPQVTERATMLRLYPFALSLVGILSFFILIFIITWILTTFYNKVAVKK